MVFRKGETNMRLKLARIEKGASTHYAWDAATRFLCGSRFSWSAVDILEHDSGGTKASTCKNCRIVRAAHIELNNLRVTISPRGLGGYELFCQGIHLGWVTEKQDGQRTIVRATEWGNGETMGHCGTIGEAIEQMRVKVLPCVFPDTRKATA